MKAKNYKMKEIRKIFRKYLEVAKAINFISDFSIDQNWVEFKINYDKLVRVENKYK